jgi:hypothetical protein
MSCNILDGLKDCSDAILGIREQIGAAIHEVYLVTRTWTGSAVGDGACTDEFEKIEPTPAVKDLSTDHRVKEGGAVQNGDLQIRMLSKHRYADKALIDGTSGDLVERFYKIDGKFYVVVNVVESYITWNVQVRRRSDQRSAEELSNG